MSLEEEAYRLAYTQLRSQKEDLRALRNQASFCAAVTGLIANVFAILASSTSTSLVAGGDFSYLGLGLYAWMVLLLLAGSVLFAALAVVSWRTCTFDLNPKKILYDAENEVEPSASLRDLASEANKYFDENEAVLDHAKQCLLVSIVLGWAQIPAWVILIRLGEANV